MAQLTADGTLPLVLAQPPHSLWGDALVRLARSKRAWGAGGLVLLFVLVGIGADGLAPRPYDFQSRANHGNGGGGLPLAWVQTGDPQTSGKPGYWLGTDDVGRDMLSRTMYAARVSLAAGVIPLLITLPLGILFGLAAGYFGRATDTLVMRLIDVLYAFPNLLLFIILIGILRSTAVANLLGGCPPSSWRSR
jgi:ABC-type dipeptide/oligopeptide/nickel transport system permease subunit